MSSAKSNSIPSPESVHDAWLSQRAELEHDLFDGWSPEASAATTTAERISRSVEAPTPPSVAVLPIQAEMLQRIDPPISEPVAGSLNADKTQHTEWLKQANDSAVQQRIEHQRHVSESLSGQREAFYQDLARLCASFEQELAARESAWSAQRDQEWTALRSAKEVQGLAQQQLQDELATQRVREREELRQWRQQTEAEFAEARRLFEQDRLKQQYEFARQRETEMSQLRRDREEFDSRVRQVQAELAVARQRQDDELRQVRDSQSAQLRAERAELDKLRDTWLEKFRREQVVLKNGLQFFGQHLSRVSEELRVAQRGLQAVSESATEASPTLPFTPTVSAIESTPGPTFLSLHEIQDRLSYLKKSQRDAA